MERKGLVWVTLACVGCLVLPLGASATVLDANELASGGADGFDIESNARTAVSDPADTGFSPGGVLAKKDYGGGSGVGINEFDSTVGDTPGEIDRDERLDISRNDGSAFEVDSLTLSFLYDAPDFGDPNEAAVIRSVFADGSDEVLHVTRVGSAADPNSVQVTDDSGNDVDNVLSVTAADYYTSGQVTLGTIADGAPLQELQFTAGDQGGGLGGHNYSDFSVNHVDASVPLPSTGWLLGIALVTAGVGSRRRG